MKLPVTSGNPPYFYSMRVVGFSTTNPSSLTDFLEIGADEITQYFQNKYFSKEAWVPLV
jgi:hypothetical protein